MTGENSCIVHTHTCTCTTHTYTHTHIHIHTHAHAQHTLTHTTQIQDTIPDREVKNLTSDWNDGTLVAALVDAMAPGLCPEHTIMDPRNAQQNASQAMKLADDWLDVPQVSLITSLLQ